MRLPAVPVESLFLPSPPMEVVTTRIERVATTDATVLVTGESGVGKELVARALHARSARRGERYVKVNCAALPLELLESELFGYERGAFTGAHRARQGKFEAASGGTIFLDEIGEMPLPLQAKLLHVLQDGMFSRLGSAADVRVDARVVAATNQDLPTVVRRGTFRADLYYRLDVVHIHVPPLRQRREEIAPLAERFLREYAERYDRPYKSLSGELRARLESYAWPGNVRELENAMKRIVVLGDEGAVWEDIAEPDDALAETGALAPPETETDADGPGDDGGLRAIAQRAAREAERLALARVLAAVRWNRSEAARRLKVNYKTILHKIREHGLDAPRA